MYVSLLPKSVQILEMSADDFILQNPYKLSKAPSIITYLIYNNIYLVLTKYLTALSIFSRPV